MTAVDANTGEIAWQVPFRSVERIPEGIKTGGPNSGGGPISTAGGLIFIGAAKDRFFHAFDATTGRELWSTKLEEIAQSVPITWQGADSHQYVSIAAGSKLLAFKLLEEKNDFTANFWTWGAKSGLFRCVLKDETISSPSYIIFP